MSKSFRVAVVARLKHGELWEAIKKRGWTQKQASEFLGMSQQRFGQLVNMRWFPAKGFTIAQEKKLLELTGSLVAMNYETLLSTFLTATQIHPSNKDFQKHNEVFTHA